jgi:histidyl-tRNA synthetase
MASPAEADAITINQQISSQTALLNELRSKHADPSDVELVKKKLGELKKSLAALSAGSSAANKDAAKKRERLLLKTAKVRYLYLSSSDQPMDKLTSV